MYRKKDSSFLSGPCKRGNYFEKTKVRVGLQSDTLAEIVSGISDGDAVAVDPNLVPLKLIRK